MASSQVFVVVAVVLAAVAVMLFLVSGNQHAGAEFNSELQRAEALWRYGWAAVVAAFGALAAGHLGRAK